MPRRPIAAANWKMHKTAPEAAALAGSICRAAPAGNGFQIVLCPPFTALPAVVAAVGDADGVGVGGQNCFWEPQGAYTGEIAAGMLADLGCTHVIVGHSERRQYFGETDVTVAQRVSAALEAGLTAIVCVGETAEERAAGHTERVLTRQLDGGLGSVTLADWARIVIAYEPVWAIGTGKTATPELADAAHRCIREWIVTQASAGTAEATRILYGGSVKPENAAALFAQEHIDGGLIGGASLEADQFLAITGALAATPAF